MLRTTLRAALYTSRRPILRPTLARRCLSTKEEQMRSRATTGVCTVMSCMGPFEIEKV